MQYVIVAIFVIVCVWRLKSAITKYNKKSSRTEPTPISDSTKIEFFMQRKKRGMGKEATLADKKCLKEVAKSMGIKFFLYSELIELYNQGMLLKFPEKSPEARAAKKCQREFYLECRRLGYTNENDFVQFERMKIIARSHGINLPDEELKKLYISARDSADPSIRQAERMHENQLRNSLTKYAYLYGREKRKRYLLDEAAECRKEEAKYREREQLAAKAGQNARAIVDGYKGDAAISGGIANAVAGPIAGVVAACTVEAENAEKDRKTEDMQSQAVKAMVEQGSLANRAASRAASLEKKAAAMDSKKVEDGDPEEWFSLIKPRLVKKSITPTGAIKATVSIQAATTEKCGKSPAFIDGTIRADVMKGGVKCGEIIFCLPENGSAEAAVIEGICTSTTDVYGAYEYVLKPHKLWAIEI